MLKILNIVGARPQIIKSAAISRAISEKFQDKITDIILHTGQHYDQNMSSIFFDELNIPKPQYNLNIGSASHGKQTAEMIKGIEEVILKEKPDCVVVYGDTNSTLAAAVAASKLHFPIAHIEAGLRSFNKSMPEEINRILCDHVSTLLFSPTKTSVENLLKEGFQNNKAPFSIDNPGIFNVGDVMYDNSIYFAEIAERKSDILKNLNLNNEKFVLATIHRDNNTDDPERLRSIFEAFLEITSNNDIKIVLPLHPRTTKILEKDFNSNLLSQIKTEKRIVIIPPASFLDIILLEKNASIIITDSGGVQKEAHFFKKPCIILRQETEWTELVENGTATICSADKFKIVYSFNKFFRNNNSIFPNFYGDGKAAKNIIERILDN